MTEYESLQNEVKELKDKVEVLTANVQSLLNLWEQAKGVVTFIKWCAAIGTAVGGFIVFIKPYLK